MKRVVRCMVLVWIVGLLLFFAAADESPAGKTISQFADVAEDAYYAESVLWAMEKKITKGTSGTTFSPDDTCTQAQILTFLYRMEVKNPASGSTFYEKAVQWAGEKGLVDPEAFDPEEPCTRGHVLTYFWKMAGSPELEETQVVNDWNLFLVNPWHPIPQDYTVTLKELNPGYSVDERVYDAVLEMLDGCRSAGCHPEIISAYRTQEYQENLFYSKVDAKVARGMTRTAAIASVARSTAFPGTSEHQMGLALDIVDRGNYTLTSAQAYTRTQQWLMAHCWEYGFILRYPTDKTDLTGIIYEPWHYRYVGKEAAKAIHHQNICLEEYLDLQQQYTAMIAWGKAEGITTNGAFDTFLPASACTRAEIMTFLYRWKNI